MNKPICIVGPTGTGKTALAVLLAQQIPSVLISADSRQVYRGMDVVTGKDHPQNMTFFGLDLVGPGEPCSVSVWYDAVAPVIKQAIGEGKTPIVVGGTGFYVRALLGGIDTMKVPIIPSLRAELSALPIPELQARLQKLSPSKFASLNPSDSLNPRRLIRAIEVASLSPDPTPTPPLLQSPILIGLKYGTTEKQKDAIHQRVLARLRGGAISEAKSIEHASPQALTALGYRSLLAYLKGEISEQTMIDNWVSDELAYVKRQLTYFRKLPVIWYDRTVVTDKEIIYDILQS